jgi:hypothetical protein
LVRLSYCLSSMTFRSIKVRPRTPLSLSSLSSIHSISQLNVVHL